MALRRHHYFGWKGDKQLHNRVSRLKASIVPMLGTRHARWVRSARTKWFRCVENVGGFFGLASARSSGAGAPPPFCFERY
jgi:hypothetical protein